MNADRWHGVRGLGSIGDSGQLTGQGSATLPTRSRACKSPFARQIAFGCGAAAGTMVASVLPLQLGPESIWSYG